MIVIKFWYCSDYREMVDRPIKLNVLNQLIAFQLFVSGNFPPKLMLLKRVFYNIRPFLTLFFKY